MPRPFASWNAEIMRSEFMRCLWQGRGWLIAGVLLQSAVALYFIFISPFGLGREFADLVACALSLATLAALLSLVWLLAAWLGPPQRRDESLDSLPIPPVQRQLMDWFPLIVVPLLLSLSAVVVWGCLQLYFGVPFGSGAQLGDDWIVTDGPEGWLEVPNPWIPRVLASALSILSAGLLPLAIALLLERCLQGNLLRAAGLLGLMLAGGYVVHRPGYQYIEMCYRQTRGHAAWLYLLVGLVILATPVLLGLLKPRQRTSLVVVLLLASGYFGLHALFGAGQPGGMPGLSTAAIGDGRFALAWYFGHTDFVSNINWLMTSWKSNLLLGTPVDPHRIPIWVGAALLPFLYVLWLPGGYLLGMSISGRRADID
ncbi:MAG: hypothetical protein H7A35_05295 [Planctomycetales bacterium]|nr:hypothetical protein [bacterium]UNM09472.1 MAG: hypothetical protein H7A35_05295 [Planctomycetales bacterium]